MNVRALVSRIVASFALAALAGASSASAATDTYEIDPVHSAVIFRIQHMGAGYTYGRFNSFSGTIAFDEANLAQSSVKVEVKVDSVDTNAAKRDAHLKTPDFFNAAQFPTITFASTSIKKSGDTAYDVTGDLTMHGVTKSVSIKMEKTGTGKDMEGKPLIGFEGTLSIKRSEYDVKGYLPGIGDDVRLTLAFEGVKK